MLVDVNTVRLREKLSFQLWDSDRMSVVRSAKHDSTRTDSDHQLSQDDLLGVSDVEIINFIRHQAQPHRRVAKLTHPHTKDIPGTIEYTLGYYAKRPPTESLKRDGEDPGIPQDLQQMQEFRNAKAIPLNDLEAAVLVTPPDHEWPSGIVSVQVHEIRGLGLKKEGREKSVLKMHESREGHKGQDENSQEIEEAEGLPSSYCQM